MNSIIHVTCPNCGKELKAPQTSAGKRVQCPRTRCRRIFVVPKPEQTYQDLHFPASEPIRREANARRVLERQFPWAIVWAASTLLLLGLLFGGGYWWMGQPSSTLIAAYEDYIQTGNELIDLQESVTDLASAKRLEDQLKAKAVEHLQCRKRKDDLDSSTSERKRANAKERFAQRLDELHNRIAQRRDPAKPVIVEMELSPNGEPVVRLTGRFYRKPDGIPSSGTGGRSKTDDSKPPTPDWKLESFAGYWVAKDFSFDIEADGRGRAEFLSFSQGTGRISISRGGKPVSLSADFRIEAREGKPVFSFELIADQGLFSTYEFEILPGRGADELKVKELRGGRIDPNPAVMSRKVKPRERWDVVDTSKGRRYTAAVNDAPNGVRIFAGQPCMFFEDVPGKGILATPQLSQPGHLWIVGKGGVTWNGTKYPAGSIIFFGEDRQPERAEDRFRAWFQTSKPIPAYAFPEADGREIHTFPANSKIRLLVPDSDKNGYHKVALDETGEKIAWIAKAADLELVFTERIGGASKDSGSDTTARLDVLVGEWETPALSLKIERGGKGRYVWLFSSGDRFSESVGDLTVAGKNGKVLISMSPTVFGEKRHYQFIAKLNGDKTILDLEEVENRSKSKTLKKKKSVALQLSDLKVTKTTFTPPSVEFTIRLHLAGGELLEAWASVGIPDAGKTLEVFAGALHSGLLNVNGIDFANPDPSLKAQRVGMKKNAQDADLYECTVRYPKLTLDNPETEFTIVAAVMKDKKIVKTNAAMVKVNLKTGEVLSVSQ